jgi:MtN3 and saliva related transmembrane protein
MVSFAPQLFKILREKHARAVSLRAYAVMVVGFGLWVAYGVLLRSWPIAFSNTVNLALAATILILKFRYGER